MQKYEIMAIIANSLDEKAAAKHAQDGIVAKIKNLKGNVTFEDFWGSRGFAYRIKKQTWGYYFVAQFELDHDKVAELRRELNLDTNIVRFLTTKVDAHAPAPRKYADMQAEYAAQTKKKGETEAPKAAPSKKEKLTTVKAETETKVEESKKEDKPQAAPAKTEEPKDAVDKKLDDIIDASSADL